jgi:hypothetical protein
VHPFRTECTSIGRIIGQLLCDAQLQGPRSRNADLGIGKFFTLPEKLQLQFRAEAFNITNTPNYGTGMGGPPGGGGAFGIGKYACQDAGCNATTEQGFGSLLNSTNDPRIFQFGLKLIY